MNKRVHTRNAFHFSCWGARAVRATYAQTQKDNMRFVTTGNDGEQHNKGKGFYVTHATIPACIPDGAYVFGWSWFGGTGTRVMVGAGQQRPNNYGFFADYWSCSSVQIRGGVPLREKCEKKFVNDMTKYSKAGCMAMNNRPGVCSYEPCRVTGTYRKPAEFVKGKAPPLLKKYFSGPGYDAKKLLTAGDYAGQSACHCLSMNFRCVPEIAKTTKGACLPKSKLTKQKPQCAVACCKWCLKNRNHAYCKMNMIRNINSRMGRSCS